MENAMENTGKRQKKGGLILDKYLESPLKGLEIQNKSKKRGRPAKTAEDVADKAIREKVSEYFLSTAEDDWTYSGMARALGFRGAPSFIRAAQQNKGSALSDALSRIEEHYEKMLLMPKISTGAIFALKQVGWDDRQKVEAEVKKVSVEVRLEAGLDDLAKTLNPSVAETGVEVV